MAHRRIANIIANETARRATVREVYEIPAQAIGAGFSVGEVEIRQGTTMLNELDRTIRELTFVEAGLRAADEGYDAIYISPVADYGVRQLRACVEIPVIGAGQATMQVAAGLGRRFAIVTVWPPILRPAYERQIVENGFQQLCSDVRFVTEDHEMGALVGEQALVKQMSATRRGALVERVIAAAREAVKGGADVIMLGCTCMSPIRDELAAALDGAVVLDPLITGYKYAEMLLSLGVKLPLGPPSAHARQLRAMIDAMDWNGAPAEPCDDRCELAAATLQAADH